MTEVRLLGFDFGSTTSHAMVACARVVRNGVTGRMELQPGETVYRSEPRFTPLEGDRIDERALAALIDSWLAESGVQAQTLTSGGAIVTGLAAQAANAQAIAALVRARLGDAVIAVAADPCLESWLAFMGSCSALSRATPDVRFLNLDIGGGTTNFALGQAGEVQRTGCYLIGARHVQVVPGSYRLLRISRLAESLFASLGIDAGVGRELTRSEVDAFVDRSVERLERIVLGDRACLENDALRGVEQVRFAPPSPSHLLSPDVQSPRDWVIALSGGVGELAYRFVRGEPMPARTAYGDLGIELAQRIAGSPLLGKDLRHVLPHNGGRATVYGLALHNTEVSGSTLYLPRPGLLPLRDVPIVGQLSAEASDEEVRQLVTMAARSGRGACLALRAIGEGHQAVRRLGGQLSRAFVEGRFPSRLPLVLFVPRNVGKALGSYATDWGRIAVDLIVIDEVAIRDAHFASLGAPLNGVVPVAFYGMH